MRPIWIAAAAIAMAGLGGAAAALADPTPGPSLSVTGSGSVSFKPDIARISLGVRAEASSAASAAGSVNSQAQAVINALRKIGIPDADMQTSGYGIEYQPPQTPEGVVPAPAGTVQTQSVMRRPIPRNGTYVATETIDVKAPIAKAGPVLDSAIAAGANETYGLSFDTSNRDALYRQALGRAVSDARAQAGVLARAAGVSIAGVQSISAGGPSPMPMTQSVFRMAAVAMAPAPVMGGTGTIQASVEIVFRIR